MLIYAGLKTRQPAESVVLCVTWYLRAHLSCFLHHDVDTPLIEVPTLQRRHKQSEFKDGVTKSKGCYV